MGTSGSKRLPLALSALLVLVIAGIGAIVSAGLAIGAHGMPYGGCAGLYPATCEYAFQTGGVVGGLAGIAIGVGLLWPAVPRHMRIALVAAGACALIAVPLATYLVARTDPTNHETGFARMAAWVSFTALAAAALGGGVSLLTTRTKVVDR